MYKILNSIEKETTLKCYRSIKYSLDDTSKPIIQYDDADRFKSSANINYAEEDKTHKPNGVSVKELAKHELGKPLFKYFLDGSRKTYKIDDIAVGDRIYPIVAGQIVVGVCYRENAYSFKPKIFQRLAVLSMPDSINVDDLSEIEFFKDLLKNINKVEVLQKVGIKIDKNFVYKTNLSQKNLSQKNKKDKDIYEDLAVTCIQNEMMDIEQETVRFLCSKNLLNDSAYLIKDGSLEYSIRHSNMKSVDIKKYKENYRYVVGISKSFNPDLFKDKNGKSLSTAIANLEPFYRTKAFYYAHEESMFAVWYLRIRENKHQDNQFSGVVKIEMLLTTSDELDYGMSTDVIDLISANVINERNPVCFGKDSRWANHIYPVYLTESFLKSQYLNNEIFLNLF